MPSPTIVLVHGAFGDASSWRPVFDRLVDDGHTVLAPPNPLRGLPYDAPYTASVIDQIDGGPPPDGLPLAAAPRTTTPPRTDTAPKPSEPAVR